MTGGISEGCRTGFRISIVTLALALAASPADAQSFLPDPVEQTTVAVQWEKPFLSGADGLSFYSSILEGDVIFPVGTGRSLQIGVPLAIGGTDTSDGGVFLGNLRASLLFGDPGAPSGFVGVTLPTASDLDASSLVPALVGALPRLDEPEKWGNEAFSARGAVIPSWPLENGGQLGLRLGGAAVVRTNFENLLVFGRAAGWGRFPVGSAELRADLGTSYAVNDDDGFGEQLTAYLDLGWNMREVSGQPGLFLRVPLDGDARQVLDFSIGVSARF